MARATDRRLSVASGKASEETEVTRLLGNFRPTSLASTAVTGSSNDGDVLRKEVLPGEESNTAH